MGEGVPQKQTLVLISFVSVTVKRGRESKNPKVLWTSYVNGPQLFWYGMLNAIPGIGEGPRPRHMVIALTVNALHFCAVPAAFGFTFVNAVLYLLAGFAFLAGKKGLFYTHYAVLVTLPNLPMVWIEGVACDAFLVKYGGHFWFDFMIPLMTLLYFFVVRQDRRAWSKVKRS